MVSGVAEEDDVRSIRIWSSLEDFGYRTCSVSMFSQISSNQQHLQVCISTT